jgi:hypothetical protein
MDERHAREDLHHPVVRPPVDLAASRSRGLAPAGGEEGEEAGVGEAELPCRAREEGAEKVVRVAEVAGPADEVELACLSLLDRGQIAARPRRRVPDDLEPRGWNEPASRCLSRPYATAWRTSSLSIGGLVWLIVT